MECRIIEAHHLAHGLPGDSAYEIAVRNGFVGTEEQWLDSLVGPRGAQGDRGERGIQGIQGVRGEKGDPFRYEDFTVNQLIELKGARGDRGEKGDPGDPGKDGEPGQPGAPGAPGVPGQPGEPGHSPIITATKADGITTIYADGVEIGKVADGEEFNYVPLKTVWANNTYHIEDEQGNTKTFAEIVELFNNPRTFVYVVSANVIHIPAFVETHGMEFQGSYIYDGVGHLRRVIINDQNQVRISDIDLETTGYKTNDIHNWAVDESDPYYPTASAVVDYVADEIAPKADLEYVSLISEGEYRKPPKDLNNVGVAFNFCGSTGSITSYVNSDPNYYFGTNVYVPVEPNKTYSFVSYSDYLHTFAQAYVGEFRTAGKAGFIGRSVITELSDYGAVEFTTGNETNFVYLSVKLAENIHGDNINDYYIHLYDGSYIPNDLTAVDKVARKAISDIKPMYVIPEYFNTELNDAIAEVKTNMLEVGNHGVTFAFITDIHNENNAGNSHLLVGKLMEETGVNVLVNGGDNINNGNNKDQMLKMERDVTNRFYKALPNGSNYLLASETMTETGTVTAVILKGGLANKRFTQMNFSEHLIMPFLMM